MSTHRTIETERTEQADEPQALAERAAREGGPRPNVDSQRSFRMNTFSIQRARARTILATVLATGGIALVAPGAVSAGPTFSVSVTYGESREAATGVSTSAEKFLDEPGFFETGFRGHAAATPGHLSADVQAWVGILHGGPLFEGGSASASFVIDDLVFTGPDETVETSLRLSVGGSLDELLTAEGAPFPGLFARAESSVRFNWGIVDPSGDPSGGGLGGLFSSAESTVTQSDTGFPIWCLGLSGFFGDELNCGSGVPAGYSVHGTYVSTTLVLPTNRPLTLSVDLGTAAGGRATSPNPGPRVFVLGYAGFADTVAFPASGPVFNLPAGFSVSSAQGRIVDNRWHDPSDPEPQDSTAPVITPTVSGTPGGGGFYTSDASLSWAVEDPESEITQENGCETQTVSSDTTGTTFTCEATSAGGTSSASVTIKRDATVPDVAVPADITVEGTGLSGTAVEYLASASDNLDPSPVLSCTPTSGSTFPLGTTTVTCEANDEAGNSASRSFGIRVIDTIAPALSVPAAVSRDATSPAGVIVSYSASASDIADPVPNVSCLPASGAVFAIGTTVVTCTAADDSGNAATKTFSVHVRGAAEQIVALIDKTLAYLDLPSLKPALRARLEEAAAKLVAKNKPAACKALNLFIAAVRLAPASALSAGEKSELVADATRIKAVMGCP